MYTLLLVLMVLASLLLIVAVLLQNAKSDGMQSSLGSMGGNKLIGVKKTADGIEQITWILGVSLLSMALLSSIVLKKKLKKSLISVNVDIAKVYEKEDESDANQNDSQDNIKQEGELESLDEIGLDKDIDQKEGNVHNEVVS